MSGGGRSRGELDAQFGAARKLRPEFELRQLKASVRSRLFGTAEPSPTIGGYTVRHLIGRGGSGTVYAAVGPDGEPVALKVLQGYTPAALYRLKIEFRALAGVVHPNLVPLHKLVIHAGQAFLTMELIDGVDFLRHVRGESGRRADIPKLRAALAQLVAGIAALHAAGKLHRDIKPSNVLVTTENRVAILDFGLVHDLADDQSISRSYETVVGTPAYMAPELATGLQPRPASDWYSVGVMLYEALVGELPFTGSGLEVLCAKCREDPPRSSGSASLISS